MDEVICSRQGYEKLEAVQIAERTRKVREGLNTVFLYKSIWRDAPAEVASWTRNTLVDRRWEEDRTDLQDLDRELDKEPNLTQIEPFVFNHPLLVARMIVQNDLDQFAKYGFGSKRDFAKAIVTYCISERRPIQGDKRCVSWRNERYQNRVDLIDHGDLNVRQTDITGKLGEDIIINPQTQGFGIQQDWSPFLVSVLKYAERIGQKNIPEIRNWRDLAKKVRTTNPWGTDIPDPETDSPDVSVELLFSTGLAPLEYPLRLNDRVVASLGDGNLELLRENPKGEVELFGGRLKGSRIITYFPTDIPNLLRANYQLFARSVSSMAQLMDYFNSKETTIEPMQ